jgi:hypothetical protein
MLHTAPVAREPCSPAAGRRAAIFVQLCVALAASEPQAMSDLTERSRPERPSV